MPQEVNNAKHLRDWFRTCPALAEGNRFRIDYLAENPTEYAIYAVPSQISYRENVAWIIEQNTLRNFPELDEGRVKSIVPTLTAYPAQIGSDAAKYQIQLRMTYRRNS